MLFHCLESSALPILRLEWANAHIRWRLALWRGVLFTDESRFHCTGQMADCVYGIIWWAVCWFNVVDWVAHGGGGVMVWAGVWLWSNNTDQFIDVIFECTEIPWRDPEPHCCAINPQPSPHVAALKCTAPCCKDLYTIPGSWQHPSSCMASILTGNSHPLSMFGMLWIGVYDSGFQFQF